MSMSTSASASGQNGYISSTPPFVLYSNLTLGYIKILSESATTRHHREPLGASPRSCVGHLAVLFILDILFKLAQKPHGRCKSCLLVLL